MNKPEIIAIAALGKETRYICHDNDLLWRIADDLQRVKEATLGFPLIMGRKTYESIGKPLPKRSNIIITRDKNYKAHPDCIVTHSLEEAIESAKKEPGGDSKIFIFGGAEIYALAMDITDKLMLTLVDSDIHGTAKFPQYKNNYIEVSRENGGTHVNDSYEWVNLERK